MNKDFADLNAPCNLYIQILLPARHPAKGRRPATRLPIHGCAQGGSRNGCRVTVVIWLIDRPVTIASVLYEDYRSISRKPSTRPVLHSSIAPRTPCRTRLRPPRLQYPALPYPRRPLRRPSSAKVLARQPLVLP